MWWPFLFSIVAYQDTLNQWKKLSVQLLSQKIFLCSEKSGSNELQEVQGMWETNRRNERFALLDHVYKLPYNLRYLIKAYICLTIALAKEDGSDPDMAELVSLELEMLFEQLKDLEDKLKVLT